MSKLTTKAASRKTCAAAAIGLPFNAHLAVAGASTSS